MKAKFYFDKHPPIQGDVVYAPRGADDVYWVTRVDLRISPLHGNVAETHVRNFRIKNFSYMEVLDNGTEDTTVQALPTVD